MGAGCHAAGVVDVQGGSELEPGQGLRGPVNAKYYVDEFYEAALIEPIKRFSAQLWSFDTWVVDGVVNGAARATLIWAGLMNWVDEYLVDGAVDLVEYFVQETSGVFRGLQTGRVQNYAFVMFLGFLVFAFWKFLV